MVVVVILHGLSFVTDERQDPVDVEVDYESLSFCSSGIPYVLRHRNCSIFADLTSRIFVR